MRCSKLCSILACLMMTVTVSGQEKPKQKKGMLTRSEIMKLMEAPCPEVNVDSETSLSEVLKKFMADFKTKSGVDIGFIADKPEFELEGIASLDDVMVRPIRIPEDAQESHEALRSVFRFATEDEPALTYAISNGMLLVTTLAKAESDDNLFTKVYDLSEFLVAVDEVPESLRDRIVDDRGVEAIVSILESSTTPPARWQSSAGEGGAIGVYGQYIFVRQTLPVHRQIEGFFALLRDAIEKGGTPIVLKPTETPATEATVDVSKEKSNSGQGKQQKKAFTSGAGFF